MIISKTPLRISFAGGGSDMPAFYERAEGAVVSVTAAKYIYVTVNEKFDSEIRVSYLKTENAKNVEKIKHPIVKEALKKLGISGGVEITSIADIPSRGTGLGSSSAFTVGLVNALRAHQKNFSSPEQLARDACELEIGILKEPIGKQDQYASAYGGLNFIRFHKDGSVNVDPIICAASTRMDLEKNTLMFYTGITRPASEILSEQRQNILSDKNKFKNAEKIVRLAYDARDALQKNNLDNFGGILHENWKLKRSLASGVSNDKIDGWYETGLKEGALGGKLLGAGGGGFLMFYAAPENHQRIIGALPELRHIPFKFDYSGSKIIFIH